MYLGFHKKLSHQLIEQDQKQTMDSIKNCQQSQSYLDMESFRQEFWYQVQLQRR